MNIIKLSDNIGELEAVRDKAAEELQYLRSLDTAGDGKWFPLNRVLFKDSQIRNNNFNLCNGIVNLSLPSCPNMFLE